MGVWTVLSLRRLVPGALSLGVLLTLSCLDASPICGPEVSAGLGYVILRVSALT